MENFVEIRVPNIGDVSNVTVKQIIVSAGSYIRKGKSAFRLDLGYGLMDVSSPDSGMIKEIFIEVGQKVSKDTLLASLAVGIVPEEEIPVSQPTASSPSPDSAPDPNPTPIIHPNEDIETDVVVIGGGPGGYTAAFRAADLGKRVVLVERYPDIGGVCLNVGCIPSKVMLHIAKVVDESIEAQKFGVRFGPIKLDVEKMRAWKAGIVSQLTGGLSILAKQRKLTIVQGYARFSAPHELEVTNDGSTRKVSFEKAVIAAGSSATMFDDFPKDKRIVTSTGALELKQIPDRMLIIGGGVVGLEMATIYHALGSGVTVVEAGSSLIPMVDEDLIKPLHNYVSKRYQEIYLNTSVSSLTVQNTGVLATFAADREIEPAEFDMVLVAVGRKPNSGDLGLDKVGVAVDERGYIQVDRQQRTTAEQIFAIGDIVGEPMLAHKASYEGKIAAEVACGQQSAFDATVIPFVAYTDPEVAWVGATEKQAIAQGIDFEKAVFPWSASGRSLTMGRKEGRTKIIFDRESNVVMGAGIVGPNASELISQMALSIEMGCEAQDLSLTIHPHPTLSESLSMAAELFEGTITDLYIPKPKKQRGS